MKSGVVFVNLTAVNDTVWHCSLTAKLLCLLPDKHMVSLVMELVCSQSFTLTCSAGKLVLAPLLFNIYIFDLPVTVDIKFAYA